MNTFVLTLCFDIKIKLKSSSILIFWVHLTNKGDQWLVLSLHRFTAYLDDCLDLYISPWTLMVCGTTAIREHFHWEIVVTIKKQSRSVCPKLTSFPVWCFFLKGNWEKWDSHQWAFVAGQLQHMLCWRLPLSLLYFPKVPHYHYPIIAKMAK